MMKEHKKIVILGAGKSGVGAALLAKSKGYDVLVSDQEIIGDCHREKLIRHAIEFEEGGHTWEKIERAAEVVKSPGIPKDMPIMKAIRSAHIPIIGEIELAYRYTKAFLIGITGSNGKSTTAHLTYHLLQKAGLNVSIAGNIGQSFAEKVYSENPDYYVLELSSFQLEDVHTFKLNIGCLLNITADHLDRYSYQIGAYAAAKCRIFQNMGKDEIGLYNADDALLTDKLTKSSYNPSWYPISLKKKYYEGAYATEERLHFCGTSSHFEIPLNALGLIGKHNQYNSMMAIAMASLIGIEPTVIQEGLKTFKGIPHRMEWVGKINEVNFYNDSKGTNVASAIVALESFSEPIIWIVGGYDKGNDYTLLKPIVQKNVKAMIFLGKDTHKLHQAFDDLGIPIYETAIIQKAVELGLKCAAQKEVILLSPACASFDLFKNFEDRGDQFRKIVQSLYTNSTSNEAYCIE